MPPLRRVAPLLGVAVSLAAAGTAWASPQQVHRRLGRARAPEAQLQRIAVRTSHSVRFYRYKQEVDGLPVLGSEVVVTDARGGRADFLADDSHRLGARLAARVRRGAASRLAVRAVGRGAVRHASLAVQASGGRALTVWRVVVGDRSTGPWEVLVDARSGAVVRTRNLRQDATGSANLFDPNPVVMNGGETTADGGTTNLPATGDADSAAFTYSAKTLPRLIDSPTNFCLQGQWVKALTTASDTPVCAADATRNFTAITRSNSKFEALMSYFHIDRAQAYIQSLGFTNVNNRQILVHADAIPDDNAYYDPDTKEITLGTGGIDDGEDAEVIVHEYGHSVQDNQVPGFGNSADSLAMGEGFGDYLASAISKTYAPNPRFDPCFSEWDSYGSIPTPGPECLRRLDWNRSVGQTSPDCTDPTDEHCRGEVWSAALWTIRGTIGATKTDRLVIQSQFSLTPSATFQQASEALLAADSALYGGVHLATIGSILNGRGLYTAPPIQDGTPSQARPLGVPGLVSESLTRGTDNDDVWRVSLVRGHPIVIRLRSSADFDLRLLPPGAASVDTTPVAFAETTSGNEDIHYKPTASGDYSIDAHAASGAGPYTLEVASDDQDGDQVANAEDDCPTRANASQRDWDDDGKGDVCDPSSKVSITSVRHKGSRVAVRGRLLPITLSPRAFHLYVSRRSCRGTHCHYHRMRTILAKKASRGRVTLRLRLGGGQYRFEAALRAKGYRRTHSRRAGLNLR
jgi:Zn-dependent metalloprotease